MSKTLAKSNINSSTSVEIISSSIKQRASNIMSKRISRNIEKSRKKAYKNMFQKR